MKSQSEFLTAIRDDWTPENIAGLVSAITAGYAAVIERTNPSVDPIYDTPNLSLLQGYTRWNFVDSRLYRACDIGLITGIKPKWVPLTENGTGIMALELQGRFTSLMAHHLQNAADPPRYSELRYDRRLRNWQNPMLPGYGADEPTNGLIHLTLVHGNKNAEFAFLRIFDNPDDPQSYVAASGNIMLNPSIMISTEAEHVEEPKIELKKESRQDEQRAQNE